MKALTTELLTLDDAMRAQRRVPMYTINTKMDPIVPADFYLGTRPDMEVRYKVL